MLGIPLPFVLGAAPSAIVVEPITPPITNDTVAAPHTPPRHHRVAVEVAIRGVGARAHLGVVVVSAGIGRLVGVGASSGVGGVVVSAGSSLRLVGLQGASSGLGVTQVSATSAVQTPRVRASLSPKRDQIDRDWQQLQQAEDDEQVLALMGILR